MRDNLLRQLKENLHRAQHRMKQIANRHRSDRTFHVGDWVWVRLQPYKQLSARTHHQHKLHRRYYGPFLVLERVGEVAYRLKLPSHIQLHPVFHVSLLKKFVGDPLDTQVPLPPLSDGASPILTPVKILAFRTLQRNGSSRQQALVQWESLPESEATWEDLEILQAEYPSFNLEDKVATHGEGNDAVLPRQLPHPEPKQPSHHFDVGDMENSGYSVPFPTSASAPPIKIPETETAKNVRPDRFRKMPTYLQDYVGCGGTPLG